MTLAAMFLEEGISSTTITVGGVIILAVGVFVIYQAVKKFRRASVVAGTTEVAISALGPGLIRLFGKAEGDELLTSPVTGAQCYYYDASARKRVGEGQKATWEDVRKSTKTTNFYLNDGTGRVLVNAAGAEFDVTNTLSATLQPESGLSCTVDPSLNLPVPTEQELRFLLQWDWQQPRTAAMAAAAGQPAEKETKRKWWVPESIDIEGFGELSLGAREAKAFRITETCLLAGNEYSIVGVCEKKTGPDGRDEFVMNPGTAGEPFVISSKRGRQMAGSLRKNAFVLLGCGIFALGFGIMMMLTSHGWGT